MFFDAFDMSERPRFAVTFAVPGGEATWHRCRDTECMVVTVPLAVFRDLDPQTEHDLLPLLPDRFAYDLDTLSVIPNPDLGYVVLMLRVYDWLDIKSDFFTCPHRWVNVGFYHYREACKYCDLDKPAWL